MTSGDAETSQCSEKSGGISGERVKRHLPPWLHQLFEKHLGHEDRDWSANSWAFLEDVRDLFPRAGDCSLEPNKILDDLSDDQEMDESSITSLDEECRNMSELVEGVEVLLKSRVSTLMGPRKRSLPRKEKNHYYVELKYYLKQQGFKEKMADVMYKMFLLHPHIPENPVKYIQDNYGLTKEEELALVKKWLRMKCQIDSLKRKNLELKSRVSEILMDRVPIGQRIKGSEAGVEGTIEQRIRTTRTQTTVSNTMSKKKKRVLSFGDLLPTPPKTAVHPVESWTRLHPVAKHPVDWSYESKQEYLAQDSKVPFEPPDYELKVAWNSKPLAEGPTRRRRKTRPADEGDAAETSSSSDYSVQSLPAAIN